MIQCPLWRGAPTGPEGDGPRPRRRRLTVLAALVGPALLVATGTTGGGAGAAPQRSQSSSPAAISAQGAGRTSTPSARSPADAFVSGKLSSPGGPYLVDHFGRTVVLHGVNAVYKYAPFELYPDPGRPWNFDAQDARRIAALGFNVVRLGILWQGIEPGTGGPNQASICTPGAPVAPI